MIARLVLGVLFLSACGGDPAPTAQEETNPGKTIDVKGIVDFFDGNYQIKVFSANDITIQN